MSHKAIKIVNEEIAKFKVRGTPGVTLSLDAVNLLLRTVRSSIIYRIGAECTEEKGPKHDQWVSGPDTF